MNGFIEEKFILNRSIYVKIIQVFQVFSLYVKANIVFELFQNFTISLNMIAGPLPPSMLWQVKLVFNSLPVGVYSTQIRSC